MSIWRLEPRDLNDLSWEASNNRGPVLVRASSEAAAREMAEKTLAVKTRFTPGKGMHVPPWRRPRLVDAKIVEDAVYPQSGPEEILERSFAGDLPRYERRRARGPARPAKPLRRRYEKG